MENVLKDNAEKQNAQTGNEQEEEFFRSPQEEEACNLVKHGNLSYYVMIKEGKLVPRFGNINNTRSMLVANEEMAFLWGGTKGGVRPLPPDMCSRQRMRSTNLHPRPATSARARTRTSM